MPPPVGFGWRATIVASRTPSGEEVSPIRRRPSAVFSVNGVRREGNTELGRINSAMSSV